MAQTNYTAITSYRREMLCKATSGAIDVLPPVTHIAFGDGGTGADGLPLEPSGGQTALKHEVGRFPIDGRPEYPSPTTARYTVTIPRAALAGTSISEAALVDRDGGLCAIRCMLPKGKDEDVAFIFTFDDEF